MLYYFSFYILSFTGIAIFLLTWGPGFTRDPFSFLLFLLCFCLILIRKTNNGIAAVYVAAPICAALVWFVQGSVPMEAELFQRRTLQELFDGPLSAVGDFIFTLTNPMYFSFQSTGFSGQGGRLGGPVMPNARNVMTVQAPGRTYLAGVIHNTYTGYRWHSTLEPGQLYTQGMAPGRFEMLETMTALIRGATTPDERSTIPMSLLWSILPVEDHRHLSLQDFPALGFYGNGQHGYLHTYMPVSQVTIAIGANRTGTVFRPQNTRQLWFHAAGPDYLPSLIFEPTGDMRAPGFMARGAQYSMNFLNVDRRLSFVESMLNWSHQGFYSDDDNLLFQYTHYALDFIAPYLDIPVTAEDINDMFEMYAFPGNNQELQYMSAGKITAMLDNFSLDVLAPYAESVRAHFMDVPDIVPQRVHDLVAEIIYGLDTDFERIMAIRDYLIQFPYTLSPQPVPYGVCFVDHFLFDGQEGYCTYYATAMAVMSRIAGVPSRYVEGFLLPPAETEIAIFAVTNMMAHAWVEVYLEGFGWLIVEATAPHAHFIDPGLALPPGAVNPDWLLHYPWWDFMDEELFPYNMGPWEGPSQFPTQGSPAGPGQDRSMPSLAQVRNVTALALVVLVVLVGLFILARYVQVAIMAKRVRRMPVNQQITTYFRGILHITSHCSSAKDPTETPYAYGKRVGRRFAFKSDSVLLRDLVTLYYKARYGNNQLSEDERSLMEDSFFDMLHYLRREHTRPNYLFLRYIRQIGTIYN